MRQTEQAHAEVGDRIYYTGDIANDPAWCTVVTSSASDVALKRDTDGRVMHVYPVMIGSVYRGHCDPRFVTAKAYLMYQPNRREV